MSEKFLADLHIHSKYSMATSRDCDLEHLAVWGLRKGISVIATGDFTHPVWFQELKDKLVPAEDGLFRLRDDLDREVRALVPRACSSAPLRFILSVEISTIYKRDGKTRKVHHVIYAPDFQQADAFRNALARIGNLASDGRPILGMDSRDLLETALSSGAGVFLIPAHIWTPWFSAMGSKSGFDSIADCYGELSSHIFAVETGLSSDPAMNWRVPSLDRYRLVSNSDAHSPAMLGREANVFGCELSYPAMRRALATGDGFFGTIEFFPEEGKYHLDGHRNCGLCLTPAETKALGGRCPKCGGIITVGVESRVEELAMRPEGSRPPGSAGFESIVPLPEIIAELEQVGSQSRRVKARVEALTQRFGSEMHLLRELPLEDLRATDEPVLAEALLRLRAGRVRKTAGFDGQYGVIRLFEDHELDGHGRTPLLFPLLTGHASGEKRGNAAQPSSPAKTQQSLFIPPEEVAGGESRSISSHSISENAQNSEILPDANGTPPATSAEVEEPAAETATERIQHGSSLESVDRERENSFSASSICREEAASAGLAYGALTSGNSAESGGGHAGANGNCDFGESAASCASVGTGETEKYAAAQPASESASDVRSSVPHSILDALDGEQRQAAEIIEGPLLIVAGPGTGKTRTLTRRLAHLVADEGAAPESCLAVTFTRKAAQEMRERLEALIPGAARGIRIATFHSFALSILREDSAAAGLPEDFRIADREGENGIQALLEEAFQTDKKEAAAAADRIAANSGSEEAWNWRRWLSARGLVDLDSVVPLAVEMLESHPEIAAKWRRRLAHISIDEFQDIDAMQYRLMGLISLGAESLCAIGDPDQAIYSFRGSDLGFFLRFSEDHPGTRSIRLTVNYRSSPAIVEFSSQVIAPGTLVEGRVQKAARLPSGSGKTGRLPERILLLKASSAREEAEAVAAAIEERMGGISHRAFDVNPDAGHGEDAQRSFGDFAILYRTDTQAQELMDALSRRAIPFGKTGRRRLSAHRGVRLIREFLRAESFGKPESRTVDLQQSLANCVRHFSEASGVGESAETRSVTDAMELLRPLAARSGSLAGFLAALDQGEEADAFDERAQRVCLTTMHASKGLEFPVVFIVGCSEGLVPLRYGEDEISPEELAEERRLFFVAATRARDELILTHAAKRLRNGTEIRAELSPFLAPVSPELLNMKELSLEKAAKKRRSRQLKLF